MNNWTSWVKSGKGEKVVGTRVGESLTEKILPLTEKILSLTEKVLPSTEAVFSPKDE